MRRREKEERRETRGNLRDETRSGMMGRAGPRRKLHGPQYRPMIYMGLDHYECNFDWFFSFVMTTILIGSLTLPRNTARI